MLALSQPMRPSHWNTGIQGGALFLGTLLFAIGVFGCAKALAENDTQSPSSDTITQARVTDNVSQGWLGVGIRDIDAQLAKTLALPSTEGSLITRVCRNNHIRHTDLRRGDVVVAMNGETIQNSEQFRHSVAAAGAHSTVALELIRQGESKTIQLELTERPPFPTGRREAHPDSPSQGWLGVGIQDVDAELAKTLGLESTQGSFITQVLANTPAGEGGIQKGDMVVGVNGIAVENSRQFRHAIIVAGADTTVHLELIRQGAIQSLHVKLGKRS